MPDHKSPADVALEALGFALFVRAQDGSLRTVGQPPKWLRDLWPAVDAPEKEFPVADASPFFENFLIDAEEAWRAGGGQRARSGPWVEQKPNGDQVQLDATALTSDGNSILLLEQLGADFEAKKDVLQKARETVIAHQRLNSEMQKKEILLHCVADEMTSALANIVTSLRLIEVESNPPRTKVLLGLAMRAADKQQSLINRVLEVFAQELGGIYGREGATGAAADWNEVLRGAVQSVVPVFEEKEVRLIRPPADGNSLKVLAETAHLERVLTSLLEDALERTPAGREVTVALVEEPESLLFQVTDGGTRMSAEAYEDMFARFELPPAGSQASAMRLHFCRIMVESCGGEIGCGAGEPGGNTFWIRLPKSIAA